MRLALVSLLVVAAAGASAQPAVVHVHDSACTLYDVGGVAVPGATIPLPTEASRRAGATVVTTRTAGRSSTFEVTYTDFTPLAQAAFQRAVDIWADHLTSSVPINVSASFEDLSDLGERVLGGAGPALVVASDGSAEGATVFPIALAEALTDTTFNANRADISARFNSEFDRFYFGTDGQTPADRFDFVTVVLHELGHGLGFIGSGDVDDGDDDPECRGTEGEGCWGFYQTAEGVQDTGWPLVFDRFLEDGSGVSLLDETAYPNPSVRLGDLLQSGPDADDRFDSDRDLFVDAPAVTAVYGAPAPVWAPAAFEFGSSFSHWDEVLVTRGTSAALMTPAIGRGEAYQDPGSITCAFFQDMGWPLGAGCSLLTGGEGGAAPEVVVSPGELDFGDVTVGRTARRTATVRNAGDAGLTVSAVSLVDGGGAFSVESGGGAVTLAPGASRKVVVAFAPTAAGERTARLRVTSDDPDTGTAEIPVSGTGAAAAAPNVAVSPGSVAFADTPVGGSTAATVTVANDGDAELSVSGVSLDGDPSFSAPTAAFTLAPGASRGLAVTFAPTAPGAQTATLTVTSDDADRPSFTVALSGAGTGGTPAEGDPEGLGFAGPAEVAVAPNPFRSRAAVTVRVREGQDVSVAVFDVLGRRVATLHDGPVARGETLTLALGGGRLAPGAYVVRAAGAGFVVSTPVVATR